jgi:hypothetical protein
MDMKQPWLEYITKFGDIDSIEESFIKLRIALRNAGFTEEDLSSISSAPVEVFKLRDEVHNKIINVNRQLKKYGIWDDDAKKNFDTYISRKLSKLEKKYPLNNGN